MHPRSAAHRGREIMRPPVRATAPALLIRAPKWFRNGRCERVTMSERSLRHVHSSSCSTTNCYYPNNRQARPRPLYDPQQTRARSWHVVNPTRAPSLGHYAHKYLGRQESPIKPLQYFSQDYVTRKKHNVLASIHEQARSLHQPPFSAFKYHQDHRLTGMHKVLPNGPPPFRPSTIVLGLNSLGALEKLKGTKVFKRMYKSKAYYLFLDVLEQLAILVDKIAKKKIKLAESQITTIQAVAQKFVMKSGQLLKLKWPLVMLNPRFIREILSNPTMLVMLFHAIEVAYMSMPASFWLKPLVKLIKQPTPEKEDEIWWRRKRIYEVLNGPGSSELQPNLKSKHFRLRGEPAPIYLDNVVHAVRQFRGQPAPNPSYYSYPSGYTMPLDHGNQMEHEQSNSVPRDVPNFHSHHSQHVAASVQQQNYGYESDGYMSAQQEKAFLANQPTKQKNLSEQKQQQQYYGTATSDYPMPNTATDHRLEEQYGSFGGLPPASGMDSEINNSLASNDAKYELLGAGQSSASGELMSQTEFEKLDPREKEMILDAARRSKEESRMADELIQQQSDFVDSIVNRQDGMLTLQHNNLMPTVAQNHYERGEQSPDR